MKVVKSRTFKGAYIVKKENESSRGRYVDHIFLDDFKCNNDKIEVKYVFYSANYRKWYQDTMCMSKEEYQEIRKCANI